jgi:hypothetical protein
MEEKEIQPESIVVVEDPARLREIADQLEKQRKEQEKQQKLIAEHKLKEEKQKKREEEKQHKEEQKKQETEFKKQEREFKKQERREKMDDDSDKDRIDALYAEWEAFKKADELYQSHEWYFFSDNQPRYFHQLTTEEYDPKTDVASSRTELKTYSPTAMLQSFLELRTSGAMDKFRQMLHGVAFTVIDMDEYKKTGVEKPLPVQCPNRVRKRLTNTLRIVDDNTYNMLQLKDKLVPEITAQYELNPIHLALFAACSGSVLEWDGENNHWTVGKPENLEWLMKWYYGRIHADIGNFAASMPVLYGKGKVGRNALFDVVMKQALGKDACFTGTWNDLHGSFDGFKIGKVFIFIDEIPESSKWDEIKHMTGNPEKLVKQKYGPEFVVESTISYAMGSNQMVYPLPVEDGHQMMRVSPILINPDSTFAENTLKVLDRKYGEGHCRRLLQESNPLLNVTVMTDFEIGDALLRKQLNSQWASREEVQGLLNYLHQSFGQGQYILPPLRTKDWEMLVQDRMDPVKQVIRYLDEENVMDISFEELYAIYEVIVSERHDRARHKQGFAQHIKPQLESAGWQTYSKVYVRVDGQVQTVRTTMYSRNGRHNWQNYVIKRSNYVQEIKVGQDDYDTEKRLVYKQTDSSLNNEINCAYGIMQRQIT